MAGMGITMGIGVATNGYFRATEYPVKRHGIGLSRRDQEGWRNETRAFFRFTNEFASIARSVLERDLARSVKAVREGDRIG